MRLCVLGSSLSVLRLVSALASSASALHLAHPAIHLDATITAAPHPTLVNDRLRPRRATSSTAGRLACSALSSVYSWCASSGFANLSGPSALPYCACYYNKTWVPHVFDDLATSCYDYVRSVQTDPGALSGIAPYLNVCFLAGDVSKSLGQGSRACETIATILTSCASRTDTRSIPLGIPLSGSSSLAHCACYTSSSIYAPDRFDNLASACYTYAQNLAGQGGPISSLVSFCHNVGDVQLTASDALSQCQAFQTRLSSCKTSSSAAFDIPARSQQASCLCYDTNSQWIPKIADAIASSCVKYLGAAEPQQASGLNAYASGFCESLGDVRHGTKTTSPVRYQRPKISIPLSISQSPLSGSSDSIFV
ncbi:hypothetical protein ABW21_db0208112 [Orbilia brochopaga]|nr:hypothetical protein ABW21_db0208112 [Drechslerella brochopaga]